MRKIIFVIVLFTAVVAALFWFYRSVESDNSSLADSLRAIPANAALILETADAADLWRDLSQTNMMWEELRATDFYFRLDQAGQALDSAIRNNGPLRNYLANKPIAISAHVSGARSFSYLLSVQLESGVSQFEVKEAVAALFKPREVGEKEYDGVVLYRLQPKYINQEIFFYASDGLLVLSFSTLLAEESIRALRQNGAVITKQNFATVRKTASQDARGQLYINYEQLKRILAQYVDDTQKNGIFFNQPYAGWSALDITLKSNAAVLNGFVLARDSSESWLGAFRELDAPNMRLLGFMPSNTAYFAFFGYGDFEQYLKQERRIAERMGKIYDRDITAKNYATQCDCEAVALASAWIGDQAATFITEPADTEYTQNQFAVFMADEGQVAWESLSALDAAMRSSNSLKEEKELYRDIEIRKFHIGRIYGDIMGEAFAGLSDPYAFRYDDAIVFGNSLNGLRTLINAIIAERTLAFDKGFAQLGNQISGSSNFLVYSSLARSTNIYQHLLDGSHAEGLAKETGVLRNFQAFVYQVSHYRGDLYYNNVYFRHNPDYKQETNSLWETALKAPVRKRPQLLKNHYTDALEIFMQDDSNRVYLISNTGKVLWELEVDGPVMGDVAQVDVYKNQKLQILFSTPHSIYVLDRNGNSVESYPVRLSAKATAAVSAIDYDKNRDYRYFIPIEGGRIEAFDTKGKRVEGWEFAGHPAEITSPISHLRVKSRDYIFALSEAGDVLLLNRKGKVRHAVNKRAVGLADGGYYVSVDGNTIEKGALYYIDTLGTAQKLSFDGKSEIIGIPESEVSGYAFADIDVDGKLDCVLLREGKLEAYSVEGKRMFSTSTGEGVFEHLQIFSLSRNKMAMAITSALGAQVMLYGPDGEMKKGFPLYGEVPIAIGDLNRDGYLNLVTANREGYVYTYAIEE